MTIGKLSDFIVENIVMAMQQGLTLIENRCESDTRRRHGNDAERFPKWCQNGNQHLRKNITFDKVTCDMPKNALKSKGLQ